MIVDRTSTEHFPQNNVQERESGNPVVTRRVIKKHMKQEYLSKTVDDGDFNGSSADEHETSSQRCSKWFRCQEQKVLVAPSAEQTQQAMDVCDKHCRRLFNSGEPETSTSGITAKVIPQNRTGVPKTLMFSCQHVSGPQPFQITCREEVKYATSTIFKLQTCILIIVLMCLWLWKMSLVLERWHCSRPPEGRWRNMDWQLISHFRISLISHSPTGTGHGECFNSGDRLLKCRKLAKVLF